MPWHKSNTGIILLLILFFPVGLYLMWRYAAWPVIAKLMITLFFFVCVMISQVTRFTPTPERTTIAVQPTHVESPPTQEPTIAPTWRTTHTYSGNGTKKTEIIELGDDWKLQWSSSSIGANVIIHVRSADGTVKDLAINTIVSESNTSGETEEHSGGSVYLDINSDASWTVTIQELK